MTSLLELVEGVALAVRPKRAEDRIWVGSVGYEKHRDVDAFAAMVAQAGVERLIDVRELPISRKRGFAKTALSEALDRVDVEYLHVKALGNPKAFRDLYKSGDIDAGRSAYEAFLLSERLDALEGLEGLLQEKRSVLMCVESDEAICHRQVILNALRSNRHLDLEIVGIDQR